MKRMMIMIVVGLIAVGALAEAAPKQKKSREQLLEEMRRMSPEERAAMIAERRARAERASGGMLVFPATGNVIRVENEQKIIACGDIESLSENFCKTLGAAIEIVGVGAPKNPKAVASIRLVEKGSEPVLLIAPEDCYGVMNVTRLTADSPSSYLLRQRFATEFWRVLCMTLGGYRSNYSPCVMRTVFSLKDLDKELIACVCPETFDKVQGTCRHLGITSPRRISYRRACMEGIAPTPTNDIQKAIWDKVHQLPTKPISIKPETKPVKE